MFSKLTASSLKVNSIPSSKRTTYKNTVIKKRVLAPPPSLFVDLSGDDFPSSTHTISTKPRVWSARYSTKKMSEALASSARRHNLRSKFRPPSKRTSVSKPIEIIDLTCPASIETIRKENNLYFTYDPRGVENDDDLPKDYCIECRCPTPYCAEKMFGKHLYKYMEILIGRMGFDYYKKEKDIHWDILSHYINMLEMKLCFNNIALGDWKLDNHTLLPMCIKQGSYRKLLDDVSLWKHREIEDAPVTTVMEFINDDEINDGLPPLLKRQDSGSDDEGDDLPSLHTTSPVKRTAVEQASDVSPLFKEIKKRVSNNLNAMRVVNVYRN